MEKVDALIIGGGFYGLRLALFLHEEIGVKNVLIIEKEKQMMTRASYVNQARVHNGYHYPRSILTAHRSQVNFPVFVDEYRDAVVSNFDKHYAVSSSLSKVSAKQFYEFSRKIDADIQPATSEIEDLFNSKLVDGVFKVKEYAFNSHILRDILLERIAAYEGIRIRSEDEVEYIKPNKDETITVTTKKDVYEADKVFSCIYSQINQLHRNSDIPLVPLKHEIAEMCLVKLPEELKDFSVTVMDGPFFSIMPFPSRSLHTLSHVRYTPHEAWQDDGSTPLDHRNTHEYFSKTQLRTNYKKMHADVVRYIPALRDIELVDVIREVKTVLMKSEDNDSRPILFRPDFGIKNYTCIMGGKIDNIYDVFEELKLQYGRN